MVTVCNKAARYQVFLWLYDREAGKLVGKDKIGVAVGKVVNRYKVSKHFELTIADDALAFARNEDNIKAEAAVDGLYIIRTSVKSDRMDAAACVRTYKSLAQVERAFSVDEDDGLEGAPDSSSPRRTRTCIHFSVHAGLLCAVAYARGLARGLA